MTASTSAPAVILISSTSPPSTPPSTPSTPLEALNMWIKTNYAQPLGVTEQAMSVAYVVFAFCAALFFGAIKALVVGPVAGLLLVFGNIGVIIGLFPAHIAWSVYTVFKTNRIDAALKFVFILALPVIFELWLVLSITGSVLVGLGYGFFTPWVSTFEAFRQTSETKKFIHLFLDGTWGTIRGSCTVVRDFGDICYHSYPLYLKELRESSGDDQTYSIRFTEVVECIIVGLLGLIVDIPLYTLIAVIKSPYMLFRGWQRLLHDLISRKGPFLETACIPIAGLVILLWPLVVLGSILLSIVWSIFVGLYGSVIVYQERSFKRGVAYVIAMVSEFDEYTNDWLYLREGTIFPKPRYRKRKLPHSTDFSVGSNSLKVVRASPSPLDAPAMFVPSVAPSKSVKEAIQEVQMVQIWEDLMKSCEMRGKELVDASVISSVDLSVWLRTKGSSPETIGVGLPSYALLHSLLYSIKARSGGLMLSCGIEVNHLNRPQDRLLDWFFHPVMVLKEQISAIKMSEDELRFLEKLVLFIGNEPSMEAWDNGSVVPQDALRIGQIQAISRRLVGMIRSISKFPTYRRRYEHVVKMLLTYTIDREISSGSYSVRTVSSTEIVELDV